jgi:nucleoid-associated protein YgaU
MANEPKKGLFGKAIDALTNRDEKAAAEEAQKKAAEAEKATLEAQKAAAAAKAEVAKLTAEKAAAQRKADEEARAKAAAETAKAAELKRQEYFREMSEAKAKVEMAATAAAAPKYIAEHTITGETLSDVSLKYYGNATRPYFMVIYEANKDVIGPDPGKVRPGMKLHIPELPEELKKK